MVQNNNGVRQEHLSLTLFKTSLKRIMSDALEEHDGKISIGSRTITILQFADHTDALLKKSRNYKP